jgi:hypothetical protein
VEAVEIAAIEIEAGGVIGGGSDLFGEGEDGEVEFAVGEGGGRDQQEAKGEEGDEERSPKAELRSGACCVLRVPSYAGD